MYFTNDISNAEFNKSETQYKPESKLRKTARKIANITAIGSGATVLAGIPVSMALKSKRYKKFLMNRLRKKSQGKSVAKTVLNKVRNQNKFVDNVVKQVSRAGEIGTVGSIFLQPKDPSKRTKTH